MRMPSGRIALVAITRRGARQAGALARRLVTASPVLPTPSPLADECRGEVSENLPTPSTLAGEYRGEVSEGLPTPSPLAGEGWGEGAAGLPPAYPWVKANLTVTGPESPVSATSLSENTSRVDLVIAAKFAPTAAESAWPSLSPPDPAATVEPLADDAPTSAPGPSLRLIPYPGALKDQIGPLFATYDQIVFFVSLGAVIRLIAPHLQSKHQDPGVLVVDEAGRFVIPALSGHVGGANAFAEHLAGLLGATAVLTTASDVGQTLAVDLLGRELGWRLEAPKINVTRVSAHVVNGEPIALVQEAGRRDWWCRATPPPANIQVFARFEDIDPEAFRGLLWVTRRAISLDLWQRFAERLVVYRPPEDQP